MNLTWHIVKKDLQHLKLPLLLWTVLLLGQIFLAERLFAPVAIKAGMFERQNITLVVAIFVGYAFTFFFSAAFVLEDSLVGTRMFWVTRPITGGRLLAAKALAIFLTLVLWPVIVALPWWLYCGFGFSEILTATGMLMLTQAVVALMAAGLATLAGEGSRFLIWTLTLLVTLPMLVGIIGTRSGRFVAADVSVSRVILTISAILVTTLVVIWLQYRSRRVFRSIVIVATGAVAAVLFSAAWPWNVVQYWPRDHRQRSGTEGIAVELASAQVVDMDSDRSAMILNFRAKNLPPDFPFVPGGRVEATFVWPDGATLSNSGVVRYPDFKWGAVRTALHLPKPQVDLETDSRLKELIAAHRAQQGEKEIPIADSLPGGEFSTTIPISHAWMERFRAEAPACTLRMRIVTRRPEVVLEVPLRDDVNRAPNGVRFRMVGLKDKIASYPKGSAERKEGIIMYSRPATMDDFQFRVVDRVRGDDRWPSIGGPGTFLPAVLLPVRYDLRYISMPYPKVWRSDKWVPKPEWLEESSLALVTFEDDGGFDREIRTDSLVFAK